MSEALLLSCLNVVVVIGAEMTLVAWSCVCSIPDAQHLREQARQLRHAVHASGK